MSGVADRALEKIEMILFNVRHVFLWIRIREKILLCLRVFFLFMKIRLLTYQVRTPYTSYGHGEKKTFVTVWIGSPDKILLCFGERSQVGPGGYGGGYVCLKMRKNIKWQNHSRNINFFLPTPYLIPLTFNVGSTRGVYDIILRWKFVKIICSL